MTTETLPALQPGDSAGAVLNLLNDIGSKLHEAAEMLARLVQANGLEVINDIRDLNPGVPQSLLLNLLRVGEGCLHPQLVFASGAVYQRLRAMPYTVQEQVLAAGSLEVVIGEESVRIPLADCSPARLSQVFAGDCLRTPDQQRAWLRREALASQVADTEPAPFPWVFRRGRIVVTRDSELTRKDVLRMLEEFK